MWLYSNICLGNWYLYVPFIIVKNILSDGNITQRWWHNATKKAWSAKRSGTNQASSGATGEVNDVHFSHEKPLLINKISGLIDCTHDIEVFWMLNLFHYKFFSWISHYNIFFLLEQNSLTAVEHVKLEASAAEEQNLLYEQCDLRIEVVELTRLAAIKVHKQTTSYRL